MRVLRSRDDVLFLAGGSNDVLRLYDADGFAALVPVDAWRARLGARAATFSRLGVPWCQILAPEKLSIVGDSVVADQVSAAIPPATRLRDALSIGHVAPDAARHLVDPACFLREQRDRGYVLYPRTDSHWTCVGALCAFQWVAPLLGVTLDYTAFQETQLRVLCYHGDLWSETYGDIPPDRFERRAIPTTITRIGANDIVRLKEELHLENEAGLHVGSYAAYRNSAAQLPERLVLFGSSFSDYRAECSLLTFVATLFFREVHFVWSTSLDIPLIERLAPDRVLIEMPERFITTCPSDEFDLVSYGAVTTANWRERRKTSQ